MVSQAHIDKRNSEKDNLYALICFAIASALAMLVVVLQFIFEGTRWPFMSAILMAIAIDTTLWFGVVNRDHRSFALKFAFVGFMVLKIFPIGACLSLPLGQDYLFPGSPYLLDSPIRAVLGGNIRSFAIALVYIITRPFFISQRYDVPIRRILPQTTSFYEVLLIFAGFADLFYWIAVVAPGGNPIFYFSLILRKPLLLIPFFVGFIGLRFKKAFFFWLIVLGLQLMISFLTGTRGAAFTPIIYFIVGVFLGLPGSKRLKWGVSVLLPICVLLAASAVFIGIMRDAVGGRTDLKGALTEGSLLEKSDDTVTASQVHVRGNYAFEAFRRMTLWPDYVVSAMTPDPVPYRGFKDLELEFTSAFQLGIFALDTGFSGSYYFGGVFLKQYGFAVHFDEYGKKISNVELPVQVDAFMRGGWIAAIIYSLVAYLIIFLIERLFRKYLFPQKIDVLMLMIAIFCYVAFRSLRGKPLIDAFRQLCLEGTFSLIVFSLLDLGFKNVKDK